MRHLSAAEFIDLAEGTLAPARAAHADRCDACRGRAAIVRDALTCADASAGVPEPSPVFWDQFSTRVRAAIAETPQPSAFSLRLREWQPMLAAAALLAVVVSGVLLARDARIAISSPAPAPTTVERDHVADPAVDPSHAAAWAVLTAAAADLQFDEARDAGMDVPSAAVDRAVTQLTRDELSELGRLLQSELKRSSN